MARTNGKKSSVEARFYKDSVQEKRSILPPTDKQPSGSLNGSDEPIYGEVDVYNDVGVRERNRFLKALDSCIVYARKNLVGVVLGLIVTFFITYTFINIYTYTKDVAILSTRVENLNKMFEKLDNNKVNKDVIDIELNQIRSDLTNGQVIEIKDIENRINLLEVTLKNEIERLKQ